MKSFISFFHQANKQKKMRNRQQPDPSLVDTVRSHSASVAAFFEPALPYATQAAASALAFTAGLVATQVNKKEKKKRREGNPDDDDDVDFDDDKTIEKTLNAPPFFLLSQLARRCLRMFSVSLHEAKGERARREARMTFNRWHLLTDTKKTSSVQKKKNAKTQNKQATCFALRLSCATPLLAPAAGALGVGVSSALAGQASLRARRNLGSDAAAGTPVPRQWRRADVLCDAAVGVLLFRAMGGRFRSLLPSDLVSLNFRVLPWSRKEKNCGATGGKKSERKNSFCSLSTKKKKQKKVKPGACAVESLPAPGSQYASDVSKGELARLMRR